MTSMACTLRPSIVMSPLLMGIKRFTILSAVVLPPPEGPIRTQISPAGIVRERSWIAATARPG